MTRHFNPPPGWPPAPKGWSPGPDWVPDPTWPDAPDGWDFWVEDGESVTPSAPWPARNWQATAAFAVLGGFVLGALLTQPPTGTAVPATAPTPAVTITVSAPPVTVTPAPVTITPAPATVTVTETAPAPAPPPQAWASVPAQRDASDSKLDPRFKTCKEAKANGYGNYRRGTDPEYDWYRDADSDGIVCE